MISKINNQNMAIGRNTNTRRPIHMIELTGSLRAKLALEQAIGREYLHSVITTIGHYDIALVVNGATLWPQELTVSWTLAAQEFGRLKIGIYDKQTVIVEVGHDYLVLLIESYAARRIKLLPQRTVKAVLVKKLSIQIEELYAVIARVRNEDIGLAGDGHVPRVVEVGTGLASLFAKFEQKRAVRLEHLYLGIFKS